MAISLVLWLAIKCVHEHKSSLFSLYVVMVIITINHYQQHPGSEWAGFINFADYNHCACTRFEAPQPSRVNYDYSTDIQSEFKNLTESLEVCIGSITKHAKTILAVTFRL